MTTPILTTAELIERMTPTALAEMIASIQQAESLDAAEMNTVALLFDELAANVGEAEARELIEAAR
jgi:hypothetical protein